MCVCECRTVWDGVGRGMEVVDLEHLGEQEIFSLVILKPNEVRTYRREI